MSIAVLRDMAIEQESAEAKHGDQSHLPDGTGKWGDHFAADHAREACDQAFQDGTLTWRDILCEEFNEAMAENAPDLLRAELVQVAAVCMSWIEAIDRRVA